MKTNVIGCFSIVMCLFAACEHQPPQKIILSKGADWVDTSSNCSSDTVYFVNDILPIIQSSCAQAGCHDEATKAEDVLLDKYSNIMSTGEVVKGQAMQSKLFEEIYKNKMPPYPMSLSAEQKLKIEKWINQGAKNNYCSSACDTNSFAYAANIQPIIDQQCNSCHNGGTLLLNNHAQLSVPALDGRLMGAINHISGYKPMPSATVSISNCNKIKIQKWINAGAPNN